MKTMLNRAGLPLWCSRHRTILLAAAAASILLSACDRSEEEAALAARPVRVALVEPGNLGDSIVLSGEIQPQQEVSLAFRIGGRVIERPVNVGDKVTAGQLLAKLDPQTEQNALRAARATLAASRGQVEEARSTFERQASLMTQGFTTRPRYDQATQALRTAEARLEDAEAQVKVAQDRLDYTELRADAGGVVTSRRVEPGEVVAAGQPVLQLARADGRDAVFDVAARTLAAAPTDAVVTVSLADNRMVTAKGRVREVAPEADPVTRTFRVRIGLDDPPPEMRLGSTVVGRVELKSASVISIPASALTRSGQEPAVWVVDPATSKVSLRAVEILRHDAGTVVIAQGLGPGEIVVTAGTQALRPGQLIRSLPAPGARFSRAPFSMSNG